MRGAGQAIYPILWLSATTVVIAIWAGIWDDHSVRGWWVPILLMAAAIGLIAGCVHVVVRGRWGDLSVAIDFGTSSAGIVAVFAIASGVPVSRWAVVDVPAALLFGAAAGVLFFPARNRQ